MCLVGLQPALEKALAEFKVKPNVILLHLGGNDLANTKTLEAIYEIRQEYAHLKTLWSNVLVIWSKIIPRLVWMVSGKWIGKGKARKKVNRAMGKFILSSGGKILKHRELDAKDSS
ncbi:hypothetical protein FKM82_016374 [Ascaphus truei]